MAYTKNTKKLQEALIKLQQEQPKPNETHNGNSNKPGV